MLTVKTNHAEVLLDLVQGSPLRSAAMAAAQLVSGAWHADARTRDSGTALTIDTSIPAHLNGTAFRKLRSPPVQNQHSNSDLHQSAAWYHGEPSAATHLSSEPAQKKQRPTKLEM